MNEENNIENWRQKAQEYLDGWKRAKADYLNLKKEMTAQNQEIKEWLSKIIFLPLLGITDSFEKAFSEVPENLKNESWVKGIEGIKKQFEEFKRSAKKAEEMIMEFNKNITDKLNTPELEKMREELANLNFEVEK